MRYQSHPDYSAALFYFCSFRLRKCTLELPEADPELSPLNLYNDTENSLCQGTKMSYTVCYNWTSTRSKAKSNFHLVLHGIICLYILYIHIQLLSHHHRCLPILCCPLFGTAMDRQQDSTIKLRLWQAKISKLQEQAQGNCLTTCISSSLSFPSLQQYHWKFTCLTHYKFVDLFTSYLLLLNSVLAQLL